ncbi:MAG TPA: peptidoglycan DD-metalloendopeptidase family protein [Gaiellaceae bacterium]|nr:peptidoglycan DD-metalloendopeptidase family protein [Gaiellaceae bacterium]
MARRLAILAVGCLVLAAPAAGDSGHSLGQVQAQLSAARQKESRLQQQIGDLTSSIRRLEAHVGDVSRRLSVLEQDLALHQRRLGKLNALYSFETERLTFLRRAYANALHQLNLRMIDLYETHDPTLVEVIIESNSFQDALDRIHYLDSIAQQDKHIAAKVAVARNAMRETRAQTKVVRSRVHAETQVIAVRTQQQRDARDQLLASKSRLGGRRARQQTALKLTRKQEHTLQTEAQALAAADAQVRGRLAAAQGATDSTPSSAGLIWPVSGPVVSPFGYRWGRLHAGIDIAVPYGTPIHAAAAGTVVLAGWVSGYGNYTCIDHGGGLATCYAHQSSYAVSQGASVAQGQVIGYVGCTGHCFGPHLHFEVRINGTPVDPLGYL